MKYVTNTLMSNETLVFHTKPHWIVYMPAIIWLAISILILIVGSSLSGNSPILLGFSLHVLLALCALLLAIFHGLSGWITSIASEYAITDKRILMKIGLIRRNSLEIFLTKIESIHVKQSICGRILNYGEIFISGTGGSKDPFLYIPDPLQFRKKTQEQIEKLP
ncbi:MAG: PH domain-containing protein [Gammaproteobacteria bacterium]|nr:PH domain-containing protein [Gammaproteobacteria bacterium]